MFIYWIFNNINWRNLIFSQIIANKRLSIVFIRLNFNKKLEYSNIPLKQESFSFKLYINCNVMHNFTSSIDYWFVTLLSDCFSFQYLRIFKRSIVALISLRLTDFPEPNESSVALRISWRRGYLQRINYKTWKCVLYQ